MLFPKPAQGEDLVLSRLTSAAIFIYTTLKSACKDYWRARYLQHCISRRHSGLSFIVHVHKQIILIKFNVKSTFEELYVFIVLVSLLKLQWKYYHLVTSLGQFADSFLPCWECCICKTHESWHCQRNWEIQEMGRNILYIYTLLLWYVERISPPKHYS